MPNIFGITNPGGSGIFSGKILISDYEFTNLNQVHWPSGVNAISRHGSGYVYGNRHYMVGTWTDNLLMDEHYRVLRQGIIPPQAAPSVSVGAGSTEQICYLTYYDLLTDEHSSLSKGTTVTGNTTRAWTNLPTTVPGEIAVIEGTATIAAGVVTGVSANYGQLRLGDRVALSTDLTRWGLILTIPSNNAMTIDDLGIAGGPGATLVHKPVVRPTHIGLWVSVAGTLPRLAALVPIGVTAYTESVPTLSLGEAFLETYEPFPRVSMNVTYADRQVGAGNPCEPDTLYLSEQFEHEHYTGISFKTRYGEPITGLVRMLDHVLVLCPESSYRLQGYTEDDLELRVSSPDLGGMAHRTNYVIGDVAFIWNSHGVYMYNGAWHQVMQDNLGAYLDSYRTHTRAYEGGIVAHDRDWHCLVFIPDYTKAVPYTGPIPFTPTRPIWVMDYSAMGSDTAGGFSQPNWSLDTADIITAGYLAPAGFSLGKFYRVTSAGLVWRDDPSSTDYESLLVTGHNLFGDPGGDEQEGKTLHRLWYYAYGDYLASNIEIYPGDEYAYDEEFLERAELGFPFVVTTPVHHVPYSQEILETFTEYAAPSLGSVEWGYLAARCAFTWTMDVPGRGFTFAFRFQGSKAEWFGYGGYYGPGPANRVIARYETGGA